MLWTKFTQSTLDPDRVRNQKALTGWKRFQIVTSPELSWRPMNNSKWAIGKWCQKFLLDFCYVLRLLSHVSYFLIQFCKHCILILHFLYRISFLHVAFFNFFSEDARKCFQRFGNCDIIYSKPYNQIWRTSDADCLQACAADQVCGLKIVKTWIFITYNILAKMQSSSLRHYIFHLQYVPIYWQFRPRILDNSIPKSVLPSEWYKLPW